MYIDTGTPPQTYLSPSELAGYGLSDAAAATAAPSAPPATSTGVGEVVGSVASIATAVSPLMIGYGVHKRGAGLGTAALAAIGSGVLMIPGFWIMALVPFGWVVIPAASAYFAFKD